MRPSDAMVRRLNALGVVDPREQANVGARMADLVMVDGLALILEQGLETLSKGGRTVDMKDLATFVLRRVMEAQR